VLALAGANAVGVALFGALYAIASARLLPRSAFLACLLVVFGLVTGLWVHTEARHRALDPVRRIGRGVIGLGLVVVVTPVVVLMPLFWLDAVMPPEVGLREHLGSVMALVLISLVLVVFANAFGSAVIAGRAVFTRRASPDSR
jgi:hypothetical protein